MSTKIYKAYRVKKGFDLWKLIPTLRRTGERMAADAMTKTYMLLCDGFDLNNEKFIEFKKTFQGTKTNIERIKEIYIEKIMIDGYKKQTNDSSLFDFDVSITIHENKGRYYLIPFCDGIMRYSLDFMKNMKELEDFSYWDNVDPLESVPIKEWNYRGKIWNEIFESNKMEGWYDQLILEIVSRGNYWRTNPFFAMDMKKIRGGQCLI